MWPIFDATFFEALSLVAGIAIVSYILNIATGDHSWVDRIWSITPVIYVGYFARAANFENLRLNVMVLVVFLWGARLTFNFARKGGYAKGGEDYRWAVLRAKMTPLQYGLFNFFFLAGYLNLLLFLTALPAWVALQHQSTPMGPFEILAFIAFVGFLTLETVADQQQWNFHQLKKQGTAPKRYLDTGVFRFSRHPNFFAEFMQWWMLYVVGSLAAGTFLNVGIVGPALLTLLFLGSTNFTESISKQKYPEYADYQKTTSALVPWFPKR
jgi:steroid 5-alpha reductase family enzyme